MKRLFAALLILAIAILPVPVYADTNTLAVSGNGFINEGTYSGGAANYTNLNSNDGDVSYLTLASAKTFTVNVDNFTDSYSSITNVTLYHSSIVTGATGAGNMFPYVHLDTNYTGSADVVTVGAYQLNSHTWTTNPQTGLAWTADGINNAQFGLYWSPATGLFSRTSYLYVVVTYVAPSTPVVDTAAVTSIQYIGGAHQATLNGEITSLGTDNSTDRGFVWDLATHADPGNTAPVLTAYSDNWTEAGSFATGTFNHIVATGLVGATTYYCRAYAHNSSGYAYGDEVSFETVSTPGAPVIVTSAASIVTTTTARLNSSLSDYGGQLCDVRFAYDTSSHALFADYAHITAWVEDTYATGTTPYVNISSLTQATTYHFRVQARNDYGTTTGDDVAFATENGVMEPTSLSAIPQATTISLSWVKGTGASNTLVRYSTTTYPATTATGTSAYLGTGNSVSMSGLTAGTPYFISAWGMTGGIYSDNYTTVLASTLAYNTTASGGNTVEVPAANSQWTATPSATSLSTFPFHTSVEAVSDSYGTPLNMVWYVLWMIAGLGIGIVIYNRTNQNLVLAYSCDLLFFGVGVSIGLTMLWIIVLLLFVGIGFTLFGHRH